MSSSEAILEAIRQRRETRDRLMLQHSIPLVRQLREVVQDWVDGEFRDLEDMIVQLDCSAPRTSASERINRFRVELSKIRSEQLPSALKELDELIEYIQQKKFETAEEATETLKAKVAPILLVVFNLTKARERLDGMADMIPPPEPLPLEAYPNDEEEE